MSTPDLPVAIARLRAAVAYYDKAHGVETASSLEVLCGTITALAEALEKAGRVQRYRDPLRTEWHTARCWDGIYAYLRTEGCADPACAAMRAALACAGHLRRLETV